MKLGENPTHSCESEELSINSSVSCCNEIRKDIRITCQDSLGNDQGKRKRNEEIGLSEFMAMIDIELSSFVLVGFGCLDHSLAMPF